MSSGSGSGSLLFQCLLKQAGFLLLSSVFFSRIFQQMYFFEYETLIFLALWVCQGGVARLHVS